MICGGGNSFGEEDPKCVDRFLGCVCALAAAVSLIAAGGQAQAERPEDAAAIRAHIESIFQALHRQGRREAPGHARQELARLPDRLDEGDSRHRPVHAGRRRRPRTERTGHGRISHVGLRRRASTASRRSPRSSPIPKFRTAIVEASRSSVCSMSTSRRTVRGIRWRRTRRCIRNRCRSA